MINAPTVAEKRPVFKVYSLARDRRLVGRYEQTRGPRSRRLSRHQKCPYRVFPIRTDTSTTFCRKDRQRAGLTVLWDRARSINLWHTPPAWIFVISKTSSLGTSLGTCEYEGSISYYKRSLELKILGFVREASGTSAWYHFPQLLYAHYLYGVRAFRRLWFGFWIWNIVTLSEVKP